jgi:hypothetical protein
MKSISSLVSLCIIVLFFSCSEEEIETFAISDGTYFNALCSVTMVVENGKTMTFTWFDSLSQTPITKSYQSEIYYRAEHQTMFESTAQSQWNRISVDTLFIADTFVVEPAVVVYIANKANLILGREEIVKAGLGGTLYFEKQ